MSDQEQDDRGGLDDEQYGHLGRIRARDEGTMNALGGADSEGGKKWAETQREEAIHAPSAKLFSKPGGSKEHSSGPSKAGNGAPAAPGKTPTGNQAASKGDLKAAEEQAPDRRGFSGADDMKEKLGLGYTGKGSNQSRVLGKLVSSNSAFKKRVAVAGAAAGGSAIVGVLVFFLLLPLKIEGVLQNIQGEYGAAINKAEQGELQKLYSNFVKDKVLPNLLKGRCVSTVDATCVSTSPGASPINKLFEAWRQGRLEQKLATPTDGRPSILFGAKGGMLYLNIGGVPYADPATMNRDLRNVQLGRASLFDLGDTKKVKRSQFQPVLTAALGGLTRWQRVKTRYQVNKIVGKYGGPTCWFRCSKERKIDKIKDYVGSKKLAAKLAMTQVVMKPFAESYSLLVQCILTPDQCDYKLSPTTEGREESDVNRKLEKQLTDYLAVHGAESLAKIAEKAADINKLGLSGYATKLVAEAIAEKLGGTGAKLVARRWVAVGVPIAGAVSALLSIIQTEDNTPKVDLAIAYKGRAAAYVDTNAAFTTVNEEMKSGVGDAEAFGSYVDMLGDYTSAPLYHYQNPSPVSASIFSNPFGASVFAATTAGSSGEANSCNDGSPMPAGKVLCPEEDLRDPGVWTRALNFLLDNGEVVTSGGLHLPSWFPGSATYNGITGHFLDLFNAIKDIVGAIPGAVSDVGMKACGGVPPCNAALSGITSGISALAGWGAQFFIPNVTMHQTTTRLYDMISGGEDIKQNETCQVELGCEKISDGEASAIRNQQRVEDKRQFDSRPLFARMFSTDTPYSLVSQLATTTPTSVSSMMTGSFASLLVSPLSKFSSVFSGLLPTSSASALLPTADPFGIDQYGITDADFARMGDDQDAYWNRHCVNGDEGTYDETTRKVTVPDDWQSANQSQSPSNMQAVTNKANMCQFINGSVHNFGTMFDAQMAAQ